MICRLYSNTTMPSELIHKKLWPQQKFFLLHVLSRTFPSRNQSQITLCQRLCRNHFVSRQVRYLKMFLKYPLTNSNYSHCTQQYQGEKIWWFLMCMPGNGMSQTLGYTTSKNLRNLAARCTLL